MLGGGQLGAMFAAAARRMGYRVAVWDPDRGTPRDSYPLVDVTRVVPWPRPSKVAAAFALSVPPAS